MIMTGSSLSHLDWPTNTPLITDSCTPYTVTLKELLIITLIAFPIGAHYSDPHSVLLYTPSACLEMYSTAPFDGARRTCVEGKLRTIVKICKGTDACWKGLVGGSMNFQDPGCAREHKVEV